jgi:uncharacterized protein (TIGR00255 family)
MLKSMTGFGKATLELNGKTVVAEVRSLNSKQLDLSLKLPSLYRSRELELRNTCAKLIERGKADVVVYFENKELEKGLSINTTLAKSYFIELKKLATELNEPGSDLLSHVLKMPEVMKAEVLEPNEQEETQLRNCLEKAIQEFTVFRLAEGKVLEEEFISRIGNIISLSKTIEKKDAQRAVALRKRIEKNLEELIEKERIDQNRLEQELIYYIEKIDITEEKLRLKTHCNYFLKTMQEEESVGRKLGFITQEIGREINTIGSKANDSEIQKLVVQMKDELEKIKEQLLNVL